jgi:hypothetical protein
VLVGTGYWFDKTEGDWIHMDSGTEGKGWARVAEHCTGKCRPLLDAARFAAGLLEFMEFRNVRVEAAESLAVDARAVGEQLTALETLDAGPEQVEAFALNTASRWLEAGTSAAGAIPPGGAAFANVRAMARVVLALKRAARERRSLALDPEQVRAVAYELAEIALVDPRNIDVLGNLEVLFTYAGDSARAALAKRLASEAATQRPAAER